MVLCCIMVVVPKESEWTFHVGCQGPRRHGVIMSILVALTEAKEKHPSVEVLDQLVCQSIQKRCLFVGLEFARLGASENAIDALVRGCIDQRELGLAMQAAELRPGSTLFESEVEEFVKTFLQRRKLLMAIKASKLRSPPGLTSAELDQLYREL